MPCRRWQKQRRRVGRGVHVGEGLPVDGGGGLRVLVHDLAVGALAVDEELEFGLGEREVAVAVDGEEGVEGVAAEEPAEAGTGGVARGVVAGDEGGFAGALSAGAELLDGDDGPLKGLIESLVRRFDGGGAGEELPVALGVGLVGGAYAGVQLGEG